MSSPGQIIGGIAGAVIGAFIPGGYLMLGASIGMAIGGAIDPPKGPTVQGPRLKDLSVTGVGFDQPLPRLYGTIITFGTLIWVENNQLLETKHTEEVGGKGGGGQESETFTYSYTFALALGMGEIHGIRRIWCSGKLIYDAGSDDIATIIASNQAEGGSGDFKGMVGTVVEGFAGAFQGFRLYRGTDDQLPDSRIQADLGIDNTPAWRGMSYLVWDDFQLEDYGNSPMGAQLKVEVVAVGQTSSLSRIAAYDDREWRFAERDNFGAVPYEGYPYIVGIDDGILEVRMHNQDAVTTYPDYRLLSTDGSLRGKNFSTEPYIGCDLAIVSGDSAINACGHLSAGLHLYANWNDTIADGGFYTYPGVLTATPDEDLIIPLSITGYTDHKVIGCAIANDRSCIFLLLSGPSQAPATSATRPWVVVDMLMNVVTSGTTADNFVVGDIGFARGGVRYNRASSFDAVRGELCVVDGAGTGRVFIYRASGSSLVLADSVTSPNGLTYFINACPSVYYENGIAYVISGTDYNVFSFGKISPEQVTLQSIVEAECLSSGLLEASDIDATALDSLVRGYRVASAGALRSALEPLQAAWPFDVVPRGYKIEFVPRGQSSVATIQSEELGAVAGNDQPGVAITVSREMDIQIPRRVEVSYIDIDREYDVGNQSDERKNTDAVNVFKAELPIVFNATEAIQRAQVLLYLYWLERNDLSFVLPPTYGHLEASDVVTILAPGAAYEVRLTSINLLPDGRLECSAKLNNAAVYTSTAVADGGYSPPQTIPIKGGAETILMDLPCIDARTDACGFLAAVGGQLDSWPGGGLFYSADQGQTWKQVEWITPPGATIGFVNNVAGAGRTDIFDGQNTINAFVYRGTLSSVSELALMTGANHFAYGKPGRWEIVGAQTVTEETNNSMTLSRLIRGRFGTEDAMTTHEVGDYLVLLDASSIYWIGMELSSINAARKFRMVSRGKTLESASDIDFTLVNESRICRRPVQITGALLRGSYNWDIRGTPRSRLPVPVFGGIAQPSGETSALYRLKIYNSTYSVVKRTMDSSDAAYTYTNAQQMADFGGVQEDVYLGLCQVSPTMGEGYELRQQLTLTGIYNPMFSLIHFAASGATLTDACGLTWTNTTGYNNNSAGNYKFGPGGFYCPGSNYHYATVPSGTVSGDFTFDIWENGVYTSGDYGRFHLSNGGLSGSSNLTGIGLRTNSSSRWIVIANGTETDFGAATRTSWWNHIALERKNGVIRLYIDGVQTGTTLTDNTDYSNCTTLTLGTARYNSYISFGGYWDEFRGYAGSAYSGTNFTPPTAEYPNP